MGEKIQHVFGFVDDEKNKTDKNANRTRRQFKFTQPRSIERGREKERDLEIE
jgi:hypothetical protein